MTERRIARCGAPTSGESRLVRTPDDFLIDNHGSSVELAARQAHRKHRALAQFARHRHVAAHHARELAGEGKAEPRPAVAARGEGIRLGEFLRNKTFVFFAPRTRTDSDFRLAPGSFTKLENLILNHLRKQSVGSMRERRPFSRRTD
jgi:hypothetical protein